MPHICQAKDWIHEEPEIREDLALLYNTISKLNIFWKYNRLGFKDFFKMVSKLPEITPIRNKEKFEYMQHIVAFVWLNGWHAYRDCLCNIRDV
jgi:hypothetical protein